MKAGFFLRQAVAGIGVTSSGPVSFATPAIATFRARSSAHFWKHLQFSTFAFIKLWKAEKVAFLRLLE